MVSGRESLTRLIGKRRRFLPNRHSILSNTIQSSLNLCADNNGGGICLGKAAEEEPLQANLKQFKPSGDSEPKNGVSPSGEVDCPVCGCKIPGDNDQINSHLDVCLSRGTKRKLTQRTLLQLNFSPISKVKIVPDVLVRTDNLSIAPPVLAVQDEEEIESNKCEEFTENLGINHKIDSTISSTTYLSLNNEMPDNYKPNIFGVTFETFIVGRRYTDQEEICPGATISLLRDPQNIKDSNAIKVVSADSACCKLLGFLPREIAQYLSPLIDKYGLIFQGHVTSVPKHSLDVVPVQIMCHRTSDGENEYNNETFKCLWENALNVVEFASSNPPSSVKYQLNFCLMLQEVLRNNTHLLTEDEKTYLESFTLLSNDSQRLFVRLYTRKGPWFRMSSISYPEIMDAQKAVKELAEKGYICSVEDANQLCESDMNDILNILTVSELREIWCLLKKSCGRGMKKQHLISSLVSTYAGVLWPHLSTMILDRTGSCIRISSKSESLMWRTERLFFLNGEQDLSSFLLVDMGKIKYPTYNCIISEPIFSNRRDLLSYEEAIEVAQIMDEALDANKIDVVLRCIKIAESCVSTALPVQYSTFESVITIRRLFTASWVYSKVVTLGISFLEQERRYGGSWFNLQALTLFKSRSNECIM